MSAADRSDPVESLVSRMTLDQKLGQMTQPERQHITPEEVARYHIGSVLSGGGSWPGENRPGDWVAMNDAYWAASVDAGQGRIAIPMLYGVDAVHGHNNVRGAVLFPHNIGLGAADDPGLIERIARVTAREVLATGVEWTFAPTLAVVRNDHWGRTYESYSEDPAIVARYAGAFVRGLQGDLGRDAVVACAKHWVGDGGTSHGIDQGETDIPEEELREIHIAPYRPAVDAGVLTVMASYNSWNDVKCHANRYLLTDVLKGELGFEGFVVSDWDAIDQLADDYAEAIRLSVNAGVDMFMVPDRWKHFLTELKAGVEAGRIPMERIDDAVRRILRVKQAYGIFERERPSERYWSGSDAFGSDEHRAVAREAVRKSLVLLKHERDVLPLAPAGDDERTILVAGKSAHNIGFQCGGFSVAWQGTDGNDAVEGGTSIWDGIRALAPDAELSEDGSAADAARHRVAVVVIGERPYAEGMGDVRPAAGEVERGSSLEASPGPGTMHPYGTTLEHAVSHPEDLAVLERVAQAGVPIVTVLVAGRPLVVNAELERSSAFVCAWLPGSEGDGVAQVLFGRCPFQGRLSFSWPRDDAQNPNRGDGSDPLFAYGFGLTLD
ncbi:MAG: glycoside hydrolase family 3 protein [Candidatus Longimicrobiales bacterium M2_2A_002]